MLHIRSHTLLEEALRWCCHTLTMNGYLNESNFMMVEEGFTSRDLLESTLVELCRTVGRAALLCSTSIPPWRRWSQSSDHCSLQIYCRVTSKPSLWQTLGTS